MYTYMNKKVHQEAEIRRLSAYEHALISALSAIQNELRLDAEKRMFIGFYKEKNKNKTNN